MCKIDYANKSKFSPTIFVLLRGTSSALFLLAKLIWKHSRSQKFLCSFNRVERMRKNQWAAPSHLQLWWKLPRALTSMKSFSESQTLKKDSRSRASSNRLREWGQKSLSITWISIFKWECSLSDKISLLPILLFCFKSPHISRSSNISKRLRRPTVSDGLITYSTSQVSLNKLNPSTSLSASLMSPNQSHQKPSLKRWRK